MKALLIVDIQNDFCPGGALAVPEGDQIIPIVNRLKKKFPLVVLTQDWHPRDHISFASRHPGKKPGEVIALEGIQQILWPDHCVRGTLGAQFHKGLKVSPQDIIIRKGTDQRIDSYSAFYDNARQKATGLAQIFRKNNANEIFICGLATDYCVKFSAFDALAEGLKVHVILDVCRGVDLKSGDVERAVEAMKREGAEIVQNVE